VRESDSQVLLRDIVDHRRRQETHRFLHQLDRDSFTRATVTNVKPAAPLRNEGTRAPGPLQLGAGPPVQIDHMSLSQVWDQDEVGLAGPMAAGPAQRMRIADAGHATSDSRAMADTITRYLTLGVKVVSYST
jgi:hypothetical protein